jgi:hypothetical protein
LPVPEKTGSMARKETSDFDSPAGETEVQPSGNSGNSVKPPETIPDNDSSAYMLNCTAGYIFEKYSKKQLLIKRPPSILSGTHLLPICLKMEPTSDTFRNYWGIPTQKRQKFIHTLPDHHLKKLKVHSTRWIFDANLDDNRIYAVIIQVLFVITIAASPFTKHIIHGTKVKLSPILPIMES